MSRILIVEDDIQMTDLLEFNLQAAGYETIIARDGLEALRAFDQERPDLVLVDLNIPKISGFRLVQLLKRYGDNRPVIVVTALDFEEAEEVARSGADDFITKPCDPQDIVRRVHSLLSRRRDGPNRSVRF